MQTKLINPTAAPNYLVYTSLTAWAEPPRSRHQVTNELKKKGIVYFVERAKAGLPKFEVKQVEENVFVISPTFPVDYRVRYRTPLINEIYHEWLIRHIKRQYIDFDIVFTFDHTSYSVNKHFEKVIYYCGDDFIGNAKMKLAIVNKYHSAIEKKLAAASKLCVVTSEFLHGKFIAINKNTHIVSLGAPTVEASVTFNPGATTFPVLGLVAFINRRMPLALMDELLKTFKIILIGPADESIKSRYAGNENAVFLGSKKDEALYEMLEQVDVCIAPYDEDIVNKGLTPNKLWLYAAMGKPCVVTDVPNIKNWNFGEGVIYKTKNMDFAQTCLDAHQQNNRSLFESRINLAKENSWNKKVEEIFSLYQNAL